LLNASREVWHAGVTWSCCDRARCAPAANLDKQGDASQINQGFVSDAGVVLGVAVDPDTVFWGGRVPRHGRGGHPQPPVPQHGLHAPVPMRSTGWRSTTRSSTGRTPTPTPATPPPRSGAPTSTARTPTRTHCPPTRDRHRGGGGRPQVDHHAPAVDRPPDPRGHEQGLPHETERSLLAKLEGAQRKLDAGQVNGACGSLAAYINEVQAQTGKKLETAYAEALSLEATAVRESIGC
jgi:hypothetical protein